MSPAGGSLHISIKAELNTPSKWLNSPKIFYTAPAVYEQDRRSANKRGGSNIVRRTYIEMKRKRNRDRRLCAGLHEEEAKRIPNGSDLIYKLNISFKFTDIYCKNSRNLEEEKRIPYDYNSI